MSNNTVLCGITVAGSYKLVEQIGTGYFGVVFRATDINNGQDVAVKLEPIRKGRDFSMLRNEYNLYKAIKSGTERELQNTNSTYNRTNGERRLHRDRNGIVIKARDTVQVLSKAKSGKIGDYARVIKLGNDRVTIKLKTTVTTTNRISPNLAIVDKHE